MFDNQSLYAVFKLEAKDFCSESLVLKSDPAAEYPVYIFVDENSKLILYSLSIESLLNHKKVVLPMQLSSLGISFVLQKGVIPPPFTIFKNIFILSVGDEARIEKKGSKLEVSFSHNFPFRKGIDLNKDSGSPDISLILESLVKSTQERMIRGRPSFLFHSAGKDSNLIAVALAEAGLQSEFTLITLRSKLAHDESHLSKKIANYLGFKHLVLDEPISLDRVDLQYFEQYFETVPLPAFDKVSLAYPLYLRRFPELEGSNVIDGGGNDAYLGVAPRRLIRFALRTASLRSWLKPIVEKCVFSTSSLNPATASKYDWVGFYGLTARDAADIYPKTVNLNNYEKNQVRQRAGWDDYDFYTDILTTVIASEMHIRKFRNGACMWKANPILPYTNERVVESMSKLSGAQVLDRKSGKNKIFIRDYLKKSINLDSDLVGKISYPFNFWPMINNIHDLVKKEIFKCEIFTSKVNLFYDKLLFQSSLNNNCGKRARNLYHRMYNLSSWVNCNKYLRKM